jgi:hypothetical protein
MAPVEGSLLKICDSSAAVITVESPKKHATIENFKMRMSTIPFDHRFSGDYPRSCGTPQ